MVHDHGAYGGGPWCSWNAENHPTTSHHSRHLKPVQLRGYFQPVSLSTFVCARRNAAGISVRTVVSWLNRFGARVTCNRPTFLLVVSVTRT